MTSHWDQDVIFSGITFLSSGTFGGPSSSELVNINAIAPNEFLKTNHILEQSEGNIHPDWGLLDSQSTVDVWTNKKTLARCKGNQSST